MAWYLKNASASRFGATRYLLDQSDATTESSIYTDTYGGEDPMAIKVVLSAVDSAGNDALLQRRSPTSDIAASGTWAVNPASPTTKYDKVDDSQTTTGHDSDTSYILHGTTAGYADFGFDAFSIPTTAAIKEVNVYVTSRETASGANAISGRLKIGGTGYNNSTPANPTTSYVTTKFTWALNPRTGSAFTPAQINGTDGTNPLQAFGVGTSDANPQIRITQVYCEVVYYFQATTTKAPFAASNTHQFSINVGDADQEIPDGGGIRVGIYNVADTSPPDWNNASSQSFFSPVEDGEKISAGTHVFYIKNSNNGDGSVYFGNGVSYGPNDIFIEGTVMPDPPTNLTGTLLYEDFTKKLKISWTAFEGATTYKLYAGTSANPTTLVTETSEVNYTLPDEITNGQTWYFRAKSTNANGESDYSVEANYTVNISYGTVTIQSLRHHSSRVTDVTFSGPVDEDVLATSHFTVNGVEPTLAVRGWTPEQKDIGMYQLGRWNKPREFVLGEYTLPRTQGTIPEYLVYRCTVAGAGHATTEPTWPTTIGATVTDNQVTWVCEDMRQRVRLHHHRQAPDITVTVNVSADLIGSADSESFTSEAPESKAFEILEVTSIDSQNTKIKFSQRVLPADLITSKFSVGNATTSSVTEQSPEYREVIVTHSNLDNGTYTVSSTAKNYYREALETGGDSASMTISTQHASSNGLSLVGCYSGLEMGVTPGGVIRMAYIENSDTSVTSLELHRSADNSTFEQVNEAMYPSNAPAYAGDTQYKPWDIVSYGGKTYRINDLYGKASNNQGKVPAGNTPTLNTGFRAVTTLFTEDNTYGEYYTTTQSYVFGAILQENSTIRIYDPIVENGKKIWIIEDVEPDYRRQPIKGGETAYYKVYNGTSYSNVVSDIWTSDENYLWECGSNRYLDILYGGDYKYLPDMLADAEKEAFALSWPKFGIGSVYANVCLQTIAGSFAILQDDEFLWFLEAQLDHAIDCQIGTTTPNRIPHFPKHTQGGYVGGWTAVNRSDYVGRASYSALYASNILRKFPQNSWAASLATSLRTAAGAWTKDYIDNAGTNEISYSGTIYGVAKSVTKTIVNTAYGTAGSYFAPNQEFGLMVAGAYLYGEEGSELYQYAPVYENIDDITQLTWALMRPYSDEQVKESNTTNSLSESYGKPSFLYASYTNALMEQVAHAFTTRDVTLPTNFTEVTDAVYRQMSKNYPAWQANHAYSYGDVVSPTTENGPTDHTRHFYWVCTTAGTSGGTEPNWSTVTDHKGTKTDGTVTWEAHYTIAYKPMGECHYPTAFEGYARNSGAAFPTISTWMRGLRDDPSYTKTYRAFTEVRSGGAGIYGVGTIQSEWLAVFGEATIHLNAAKNVNDVDLDWTWYIPPGYTFSSVVIHRSNTPGFTPSEANDIYTANSTTLDYTDTAPGGGTLYYKAVITATDGQDTITSTSQEKSVFFSHLVQPVGMTSATVMDEASIYSGGLNAVGGTSNTAIDEAVIVQTHVLSEASGASDTSIDSAIVIHTHLLTTTGLTSDATIDAATLVQTHILSPLGMTSDTVVDTVAAVQTHSLTADGLTSDSHIDGLTIVQTNQLSPLGMTADSIIDEAVIIQTHALSPVGLTSETTMDTAGLNAETSPVGMTLETEIGVATLIQTHILNLSGMNIESFTGEMDCNDNVVVNTVPSLIFVNGKPAIKVAGKQYRM